MDTDERSKKPETMADFFNKRAEGYDDHMRESVEFFDQFYDSISSCVVKTKSKVRILDIGCGTGLELNGILDRAPNAAITAIDVSTKMLDRLKNRFKDHLHQITLIKDSYLAFSFDQKSYDYIVAVMTLHHLLPPTKMKLYEQILNSLRPSGKYIEGDWVVSLEKERQFLSMHGQWSRTAEAVTDGSHHVDIPFSIETQKRLLREAGFSNVDIVWEQGEAAVYAGRL